MYITCWHIQIYYTDRKLNIERYFGMVVDPHLVREGLKRRPDWVSAAKLGGLEASDNVLQCGSHHKVLLF